MAGRGALAALLAMFVPSGSTFCSDGIGSLPDTGVDHGRPSIEVIVAQASLMSAPGGEGQLFSLINWFHTAIVFRQNSSDNSEPTYWTLEFDSSSDKGILSTALPEIVGKNMTFSDLDARYCLRRGLYWGRGHWKKSFETVMQLSAQQLNRTLAEYITPLNSSAPGTGSQYQAFAVQARGKRWRHDPTGPPRGYRLVHDLTCGDGVAWFLFHAATTSQVPIKKGFRLSVTQVVFNAKKITPLNVSKAKDWKRALKTYRRLVDAAEGHRLLKKPFDVALSFPVRALYDANTKSYYRLHGNRYPFVNFLYREIEICSPTTWEVPECLEYLPQDVDDFPSGRRRSTNASTYRLV